MKNGKACIAFPILIIAIGIGWLLTTHNLLPGVDWIWILSLGVLGGSTLAVWGIDKVAIVVGPFLIVCTFLSLLGQTGRMSVCGHRGSVAGDSRRCANAGVALSSRSRAQMDDRSEEGK